MLAGISADYYLRLERGRDRHPSAQVVEAIARVLQLDDEHRAHLRALAAEPRGTRGVQPGTEAVPAGARELMDALIQPAYIEGRFFDILASNRLARALNPRLVPGGNQLKDLFLDPAERAMHPDWDRAAACQVSSLRKAVGNDLDDPGYLELVGELTAFSSGFSRLWARHDVAAQRGAAIRLHHPRVGELNLNRERMGIGGTNGMTLVVYHAAGGTSDAEKLAVLASADHVDAPAAVPE